MGHVLCWFSEILVPLWTGSEVIFCIRLDDAGLMVFGRLGSSQSFTSAGLIEASRAVNAA